MAQTGYTPISLYYSTTASQAPTAGNLANGELAINITDGKLYYKDNLGAVKVIAGSGGTGIVAGSNTQIQFNNNGVFGASSGITWDGTNLTASQLRSSGLTSGRVTYASTSGLLVDSANMTFNGTVLTVNTLSLTNALSTANGGTGVTSFTANRVFYASSTSALGQSANLTFDGTTLTANALTTTSTVTINGGTANGVAYLNGSKVLTTGSALSFDGTKLAILSSSAAVLQSIKTTSTTNQNIHLQLLNDADIPLNFGVWGSAAGSFGILGASSPFITTNTGALNFTNTNASGTFVWGAGLTPNEALFLNSSTLRIGGTSATGNRLIVNGVTRTMRQGDRTDLAFQVDNTNGAPSWPQTNLVGHYYTGTQDAASFRVPSSTGANTASYDIFQDGSHVWYAAGGSGIQGSTASQRMSINSSGKVSVNFTGMAGSTEILRAFSGISLVCNNAAAYLGTNGPAAAVVATLSNNWRTNLLFKVNTTDSDTAPITVGQFDQDANFIVNSGQVYIYGGLGYNSNANRSIYIGASNDTSVNNNTAYLWRVNVAGDASGQLFKITNFIRGTGEIQRIEINNSGDFRLTGDNFYRFTNYTYTAFAKFNYPGSGYAAGTDVTEFYVAGAGAADANIQARLRGDTGGLGLRGTLSQSQSFDYAEFFEWADQNPNNEDRVGYTVALENNKIRMATEADAPDSIIGVISGTAGVVLNAALFEWQGAYLRDDFGRIIYDKVNKVHWVDANGTAHNYAEGEVPAGVVVPESAEWRTHNEPRVNPDYDPDMHYTDRDNRPEWGVVGLMGQVRVRKGQPVGSRWIKMRDITPEVEEWLIR